jgi:light-regulated signal transduction histidine kinase (bacteriophytochrome)
MVLFLNSLIVLFIGRILYLVFKNISEKRKATLKLYSDINKLKLRNNELWEKNCELESFVYSVSQELRTPLRGINGCIAILNEEHNKSLNQEGRRLAGEIAAQAKRMEELIVDLLNFSMVYKSEIRKSPVDMNIIVNEITQPLLKNPDYKNYSVIVDKLPHVLADSTMVKQLMVNLTSNALKYSKIKKNPQIKIGTMERSGKTFIYVKDNGIGFDPQYKNKMFSVFQKLHTNNEYEGTGVGLAIASKIIEKHDGHIDAESKLNEGSTFYFNLPSLNKTMHNE